jgi:large-conductance mechanosensitive channel
MKNFLKGVIGTMGAICCLSLLNFFGALIDLNDEFGPEVTYGSLIIATVSGVIAAAAIWIAVKKYTS